MGEKIKLQAKLRTDADGQANNIRTLGYLPAVVYGRNIEPRKIMIELGALMKAHAQAGESTLVELEIDGNPPIRTLIYDVQRDAVKGKIIHVDFYQVDMKQKITTEIPLNFVGESKAVELLSGALVKNITEIEVECLPDDLISSIDVDISSLEAFDDVIKVSDIKFPKGIEVTLNPDEVVALVMAPTTEKEEEAKPEQEVAEDAKEASAEPDKKE